MVYDVKGLLSRYLGQKEFNAEDFVVAENAHEKVHCQWNAIHFCEQGNDESYVDAIRQPVEFSSEACEQKENAEEDNIHDYKLPIVVSNRRKSEVIHEKTDNYGYYGNKKSSSNFALCLP